MTFNLANISPPRQVESKNIFIDYGFLEYIDCIKDVHSLSSFDKKIFSTTIELIFKSNASGRECVMSQEQIGHEVRKRYNLKDNAASRETVNRAISKLKQVLSFFKVESTGTWEMFCPRRNKTVIALLPMKYSIEESFINSLNILAIQDKFWNTAYNMYLHHNRTLKEHSCCQHSCCQHECCQFDSIKFLRETGITISKTILRFKNHVLRIAITYLHKQMAKREIRNVDGYFYRICLNVEANLGS